MDQRKTSEVVKKNVRILDLGPRFLCRIGFKKPESYREHDAVVFEAKAAKSRLLPGRAAIF